MEQGIVEYANYLCAPRRSIPLSCGKERIYDSRVGLVTVL
jgi:hypothetical protein